MNRFFAKAWGTVALLSVFSLGHAQNDFNAVKQAIKDADAAIDKIVKVPKGQRTWENTALALDDMGVKLDTATSIFLFLQNVSTDSTIRDQSRDATEMVSN